MKWFTAHFKDAALPDDPGAKLDIRTDYVMARVDRPDGGTNLVMVTGEMLSVFEPIDTVRMMMSANDNVTFIGPPK